MIFDGYLFADYSGAHARAAQRKAIRLARAAGTNPPLLVYASLTREALVDELFADLLEASRIGMRICFGQDHQYSIPVGLGRELGVANLTWRQAVEALCDGTYGTNAPALGAARTFGRALNQWLESQGRQAYFFSATKARLYEVPSANPRPGDGSAYRLTELCRPLSKAGTPKAFNRLGDNGTVGGQSLVGLVAINDLLSRCKREGINVAVWPFDGLSITDSTYSNAHVMIEPYPTAVRRAHVAQSDESDALASAEHVQAADISGTLSRQLDLSALSSPEAEIARFEGWILGHTPDAETAG